MEAENDNLHWKTLSSKYLFYDKWLKVKEDTVELPNGNQLTPYYVLEYHDWVHVIAITKEHKFVFVKQYRHGLKSVNYELCAGFCEDYDPSPLVTAQRELLEETGYGNGEWSEYTVLSANPSTHTNLTHCFLAINVEKIAEQDLDEAEFLSVHLLSVEEVKNLLQTNNIKQALMAAPLWRYIAENKL